MSYPSRLVLSSGNNFRLGNITPNESHLSLVVELLSTCHIAVNSYHNDIDLYSNQCTSGQRADDRYVELPIASKDT